MVDLGVRGADVRLMRVAWPDVASYLCRKPDGREPAFSAFWLARVRKPLGPWSRDWAFSEPAFSLRLCTFIEEYGFLGPIFWGT
jgi:hypothetical protein